jgi:hypothetical protein
MQQGPTEVILSMKVACSSECSIEDVCTTINDFEKKLRAERPDVRWIFVEPDIPFSKRSVT